jgi:hypothetical protein
MAKATGASDVEAILRAAVEEIVNRTANAIGRAVAAKVEHELKSVSRKRGASAPAGPRARPRRAPAAEITKWVADRRARRVPNFVIEATGLDTKKKIVAKYGANVVFEKGKDLPAPGARAKSPAVRKAASKQGG